MDETGLIKSQLRIPAILRDRLIKSAKDVGRSMNSEIVQRLTESFLFESGVRITLGSGRQFQLVPDYPGWTPEEISEALAIAERIPEQALPSHRPQASADGLDEETIKIRDEMLDDIGRKIDEALRKVQEQRK